MLLKRIGVTDSIASMSVALYNKSNVSLDVNNGLIMSLSNKLIDFQNARVLVLGDVMLDTYYCGDTERISPEAPVPVVHVQDSYQRPGGAANVALNIAALDGTAILMGLIGSDAAGEQLQQLVTQAGVESRLVVTKGKTITKLRVISRNQQLIRLDTEDGFVAYDHDQLLQNIIDVLPTVDVVLLSDYNKGTLRPLLSTLLTYCREHQKTVLVDPKGADFSIYQHATLLTPNMSEFEAVAGRQHDEVSFAQSAQRLIERHGLDALLATRSEKGMTLFQRNVEPFYLSAQVREAYDVTGAGDTVIGVLAAGLAAKYSLHDSVKLANLAAGIVVGKMGTATVKLSELRVAAASLEYSHILSQMGVVASSVLTQQVQLARAKSEIIVMTNGCFDILHAGHVHYLNEARKFGDRLIVAVNSDDSVRRLKGRQRPVNSLGNRLQVLAALECVDWVTAFEEDTPASLISAIVPDKLVKGGDYRPDEIAGYETVTAAGGEVLVIDLVAGCSSTAIIKKILAGEGACSK